MKKILHIHRDLTSKNLVLSKSKELTGCHYIDTVTNPRELKKLFDSLCASYYHNRYFIRRSWQYEGKDHKMHNGYLKVELTHRNNYPYPKAVEDFYRYFKWQGEQELDFKTNNDPDW